MTYIAPNINVFPPSLDILSLRQFQPGKAHCQKCLAIFTHIPRQEKQKIQCPFCGVRYLVDANWEVEQYSLIRSHFRKQQLYINDIDNIFQHCQNLAEIAYKVRQHTPEYSPCTGLLDALDLAQRFFHFITFGISPQFLGALKLKARRIPIRGIVSLSSDQFSLRRELQDYQNEAQNLTIKLVQPSSSNWGDLPHQKLGVVDGLLTFKGSVNLTPTAYRKAGNFYDEVEVLTDVSKVIEHHNRYFSPIWADLSDGYGNAIAIRNHPPIEDIAA
ncbi:MULTISPECIES: phospholipase D-like domain-containing protein [Aerosakkonema]|uniref:phospholipase D-like domain-containing protein n=1 Tax=Aerosakkonema TaxID=1246629 RepID=UPI0035B97C0F